MTRRLERFLDGTDVAYRGEHYRWSTIDVVEVPASHAVVIRSEGDIPFSEMVQYFTQADPFEAFVEAERLVRTETPLTWWYLNDDGGRPAPGANPVREPFRFEVGYEIVDPGPARRAPSDSVGEYLTRPEPARRVARVFYQGSFPHQEHSGFADAFMTLVQRADEGAFSLTGRMYREVYHVHDAADPSRCVTEFQVEIER